MKKWFGLLCILLVLVVGCSRGTPVSSSNRVNKLVFDISANNNCVIAGETVKLRASVKNTDTKPIIIQLENQPVLDILVFFRTAQGRQTRKWSDGQVLTSGLTSLELEPDTSREIEFDWVAESPMAGTAASAAAILISDKRLIDNPASAGIRINVNTCPGPLP